MIWRKWPLSRGMPWGFRRKRPFRFPGSRRRRSTGSWPISTPGTGAGPSPASSRPSVPFFAHLVRHDLAEVNPAAAVATPKLEKTIPRCPSVEDMFRLLDGLDDGTLDGLRSAALFEVLYSTGARVSELVGLDVRDVDPRQGQVRLRGKGGKDRDVPIGTRALAALDRYRQRLVAERMVRPEADGPLFLNADGGRLTDRSVRRILARLCRETGLPAPVSPHGVRHGYATHLLDGGADLRSLQELLGHKQLSTTQKYTHVSIERLMEVHGKAHPRR